ncbi:MAG: hypothetical protein ACFE0K_14360 [Alcanivorax sp.]|uniref:hypothetical protein n=1 Tax=Alcanivorax sp. TaxID=1872427 RepID=UPI003DA78128
MEELVYSVAGIILGFLSLYLTAYAKAKGKNKALEEDVSRLEDEKQRVIAKYQAELQELKREHALDIEKRKYLYEEKQQQFTKFFSMLDEFQRKSYARFGERFYPVMNQFLGSYTGASGEADQAAIANFNTGVQDLFHELSEEQIRIANETNSIRLIASDEMDDLLNRLDEAVGESTRDASEMLKFMATPEFWADQSLIVPYQKKAEESGMLVKQCRDNIMSLMKRELQDI